MAELLGILAGPDVTNKLKLLFCLHLPGVVPPGELVTGELGDEGPEVAVDATDFSLRQ
mgnify:CR=1 FL=1